METNSQMADFFHFLFKTLKFQFTNTNDKDLRWSCNNPRVGALPLCVGTSLKKTHHRKFVKQKYIIFIGLLESKILLYLTLAKIQHCPRAGIIQLVLLVISQPGYDCGCEWARARPLSHLPPQSELGREDARCLRICDPPLLYICAAGGEEEEEQKTSWQPAVADQVPDPRVSYLSTAEAYLPTHFGRPEDLSAEAGDPAAGGASPSCSAEGANVSRR